MSLGIRHPIPSTQSNSLAQSTHTDMEKQQTNIPSLDCPSGLACNDYECEFRHLDAEEQQLRRTASEASHHTCTYSSRNEAPKVIITASRDMGRSASTWVFNAVRLLLLHAGVFCDSYWIRDLTAEKIQERIQSATDNHSSVILIKTHEYTRNNDIFHQHIRPFLSNIIVSVREGFQPDQLWMEQATHIIPYEEIVIPNPTYDASIGAMAVLQNLANHLRISTSYEQLCQTDYQLMTLPIPGNQSTKFWSFHGRRGGRSVPNPPPQKQTSSQQVQQHQIFVTRHGARQDNGPFIDSQWLTKIGHGRRKDAPLSSHGHKASQELAKALRNHYDKKQSFFIISSPLLRCMETAQAVSQVWKTPICVEPGIAEVGSRPSHMGTLEELKQRQFTIDAAYAPVMAVDQLSQYECGDGAAARRASDVAKKVILRILSNNETNRSINILFVGHGATCLGLVSAFGAPQEYVGYCSLTHFRQKENKANGKMWSLVGEVGDVAHLSDQDTALNSAW